MIDPPGDATNVIETFQAGKRYGRTWALRACTLTIPRGRVTALVGPQRRRQEHSAAHGCRARPAQRGPDPRVGIAAPRLGRSPRAHRIRRPRHAALSEPERRRHAAIRRQPQPEMGRAPCSEPHRGTGHPADPQGRQVVWRPARSGGPGGSAGQTSRAACPGRAHGPPRPAGTSRVHGRADGGRRRGRTLRRALLPRRGRTRARLRLPRRTRRRSRPDRRRRRTKCWPRTASSSAPPATWTRYQPR